MCEEPNRCSCERVEGMEDVCGKERKKKTKTWWETFRCVLGYNGYGLIEDMNMFMATNDWWATIHAANAT